jgi:cytoskeleton protein RodZ
VTSVEPAAGSIGATLAAARESHGLSAAQVAEQLRLAPEVILAMEEGRYQLLGPPVFARGHLRKYASLLGQPADELLRDYDASSSRMAESSLIPPASAHTHVESEYRRRWRWQPWLIVVAAAVIATAGWWFWQGRSGTPPASQSENAPATEQLGAPPPGSLGGPEPDVPGPIVPPEAAPAGEPAAESATQQTGSTATQEPGGLMLAFSGPCWLEVYDAGGARLAYELVEAGEYRSFEGPAPWRLVLGNAPAVSAQIGGRPVLIPAGLLIQNAATVSIAASGTVASSAGGVRDS